MSESNKLLRKLFGEALEFVDPLERAAYLAASCGSDPDLRQRIKELIAANAEAGGFLGGAGETAEMAAPRASGATVLRPASIEQPGDRIGRYKLLQQIGAGGCGVVYMAEQEEPVRRRVALKVIKLGMDTKSVIARFEAERQALALMDHPNIARVFDAGATDAGRPYFVMELVKGVRITDYCDQNNLPTTARLDLFTLVCHAIQHAHQKGIIHRDIKPSNILVTLHDGVPVPKVIDFGIAKATDQRLTEKTVFTEFHAFMGTPAYMSPEQAEMSGLDIDTRSDIYALGVLLYELLTGKTPFDGKELLAAGLDEMRRTLREREPAKPSTRLSTMLAFDLTTVAKHRQTESSKLTSLLRGDLDWIVMKALEKDRTRRYDTANAFALDIRRFLTDEPVSAAAPSAAYRIGKFARRNKTALGVAAAFAALLIVATVASTWQAFRASRAEEMTRKRVLEVAAERDAKEKARQVAEAAKVEAEAISDFLRLVFLTPDPSLGGRNITVAETLDLATKALETNLTMPPTRRAMLQFTVGVTYRALGHPREAIPLLEKARDYRLAHFGPEHPDTRVTMNNLASAYADAGRQTEALKLREETLTLTRKTLGSEHPDTLAEMGNLASSYADAGRRDEALKLRVETLKLSRKVFGPDHPNTTGSMHELARSYADAERLDEALKLREEALTLFQKSLGLEHPHTLAAMKELACSYADAGRWNEALKLREESLTLSRKVLGPEHLDTITAMNNLGSSYVQAGRRDEALKLQAEAVTLSRKALGPEHPNTLAAMNNLASAYDHADRRDEALKLREETLRLCRKVLGLEHPKTLSSMGSLASSYADAGRRDEALALREEVLTLSRKVNGPEHPETLWAMGYLAVSYADAGRRDEALALREETLALSRKALGPEHPETLGAMSELADSYTDAGRQDEALALREETLTLSRKALGPENPASLMRMGQLALAYSCTGRQGEALKLREEVLVLSRKVLGPKHPDTFQAVVALSEIYGAGRRYAEAEPLMLEAKEILQQNQPTDPKELRESINRLWRFYTRWAAEAPGSGKLQKALEWRKKLSQFDGAAQQGKPVLPAKEQTK